MGEREKILKWERKGRMEFIQQESKMDKGKRAAKRERGVGITGVKDKSKMQ